MPVDIPINSAVQTTEPNRRLTRGELEDFLRFSMDKRRRQYSVGEPHFETDAFHSFENAISSCSSYLEYGTGGSTLKAYSLKLPFTAVECDREFAKAVRHRVGNLKSDQRLLYVNIGFTREWSEPLLKVPTKLRIKKWSAYWKKPWKLIPAHQLPDLVLIDGRFRASCALESIKRLQDKSDWTLLIHDYTQRPHYKVVERFARLERMADSMAVFRPKKFWLPELLLQQREFARDWR